MENKSQIRSLRALQQGAGGHDFLTRDLAQLCRRKVCHTAIAIDKKNAGCHQEAWDDWITSAIFLILGQAT